MRRLASSPDIAALLATLEGRPTSEGWAGQCGDRTGFTRQMWPRNSDYVEWQRVTTRKMREVAEEEIASAMLRYLARIGVGVPGKPVLRTTPADKRIFDIWVEALKQDLAVVENCQELWSMALAGDKDAEAAFRATLGSSEEVVLAARELRRTREMLELGGGL
jgi:hypothetical protein